MVQRLLGSASRVCRVLHQFFKPADEKLVRGVGAKGSEDLAHLPGHVPSVFCLVEERGLLHFGRYHGLDFWVATILWGGQGEL